MSNITSINIYQSTLTMTVVEEMQLYIDICPEYTNDTVIWESSRPSIVKVNDSGFVHANAPGEEEKPVYNSPLSYFPKMKLTNI